MRRNTRSGVRRTSASLVLIASPTVAVRRHWSQALRDLYVTREVEERAAVERSMATLKPAVLLLDLVLPHCAISKLAALQRLSPSTKILLFTETPEEGEALSALRVGAKGYYHKDIDPYLLKKAVEMVQKGEIWVARSVIPRLLSELTALNVRGQEASPAALARLTPREREIAQLVGGGASNKEIAGKLNIAERTVKAHLTVIFRKLGVSDRLRLALFVSQQIGGAS